MKIDEHNVVKLKDGREGTIVYVSANPRGYLLELSGEEPEIIEIKPADIESVISPEGRKSA